MQCACVACGLWGAAMGQQHDFHTYPPLQSRAPIPQNFLRPTVPPLPDPEATNGQDSLQQGSLTPTDNHSLLAEIKSSGAVLLNDPIAQYIGRVADFILRDDRALRSRLRFYVVKSPAVNAFTTLEGDVFLTIGLFCQLETEAELAYVLCREFANYELQHAWNNYSQRLTLGANQAELQKPPLEFRVFDHSLYTAEQAAAADVYGFQYYKDTKYHMFAPNFVFDYLLYARYPYDDMFFVADRLQTDYLLFPADYVLPKTRGITEEEIFDNERLSPHPNILRRRAEVNQLAGPLFGQGTQWFQVSEEDFAACHQLCRFEQIRLRLLQRQYVAALYDTYMLEFFYPNNLYLTKARVKALYALAQYANANQKYVVLPDWKQQEGYWQRLHHLLYRMSPGELTGVACIHAWNARKEFPQDEELAGLSDALLKSLVSQHILSLNELYDQPAAPEDLSANAAPRATTIDGITYTSPKVRQSSFVRYAFVDLKKDPAFVERFEFFRRNSDWVEVRLAEVSGYSDPNQEKQAKEEKVEQSPEVRQAETTARIDRILLNEPEYLVVDKRIEGQQQLATDVAGTSTVCKILADTTGQGPIATAVLAPSLFEANMATAYNDLSYLNEWLAERQQHRGVELLPMDPGRSPEIQARYGTDYVGHTRVLRTVERRQNKGAVLAATIVALPALPYGLYYNATPDYNTSFSTELYNLSTGQLVYQGYHVRKAKDKQSTLEKAIARELEAINKLEK